MQATYNGPVPIVVPSLGLSFTPGEPVEVTAEQAALLAVHSNISISQGSTSSPAPSVPPTFEPTTSVAQAPTSVAPEEA